MITNLTYYGDEVLRENCSSLEPGYPGLKELALAMEQTMTESQGVGIAAPQVGVPIRMFLAKLDGVNTRVFVNPKIVSFSEHKWPSDEGCLSIPGIFAIVPRSSSVEVEYYDTDFKKTTETFSGFNANVIQHEYDHLNGVLFIDHLPDEERQTLSERLNTIESK